MCDNVEYFRRLDDPEGLFQDGGSDVLSSQKSEVGHVPKQDRHVRPRIVGGRDLDRNPGR